MEEILAVMGLFLLRLGVPLAITLAVGYGLRRLDTKWQAEAQARWETVDQSQKEIVDTLKSLPAQRLCRKAEDYDEVISNLEPGCALLDIPCWVARFRATGRLPAECYTCELFAASLTS